MTDSTRQAAKLLGALGGKSRTPAKRKAARDNVKKARAVKAAARKKLLASAC